MAKAKGSPKTGGRKKGTPNKITKSVREAILAAFDIHCANVHRDHQINVSAALGSLLPTLKWGNFQRLEPRLRKR
jgi:hypothetical protein